MMDYMTCLICLAIIAIPASKRLYAAKPPARLMSRDSLGPVIVVIALLTLQQGLAVVVKSMSWYDSSVDQVPTAACVMAVVLTLLCCV